MTIELDFANALFIEYLKKLKGWSDIPAGSLFSLWEEYGPDFREVFKAVMEAK